MTAPTPEAIWIAHPDVVSSAINLLVWALVGIGALFIATLIYIWQSHKKDVADIVTKIEAKVDKFAEALDKLARNVEHRLTAIESKCGERCQHKQP